MAEPPLYLREVYKGQDSPKGKLGHLCVNDSGDEGEAGHPEAGRTGHRARLATRARPAAGARPAIAAPEGRGRLPDHQSEASYEREAAIVTRPAKPPATRQLWPRQLWQRRARPPTS